MPRCSTLPADAGVEVHEAMTVVDALSGARDGRSSSTAGAITAPAT